jgi:3-phosphoshikimate 1-carboxyvinyltransferase
MPTASKSSARLVVSPGQVPDRWVADVPGSKSLTNRAVLLAGLAGGESLIERPLPADDTVVMQAALRALGVEFAATDEGLRVRGLGGAPRGDFAVWCGMAGTAARFLVPVCAAGRGRFDFDADEQLRGRPMAALLRSVVELGATIEPPDAERFPFALIADGLRGGEHTVDSSISTQFLSGLLMAAPFAREPLTLRSQLRVSQSYVDLTLETMRAFGVDPVRDGETITVPLGGYRPTHYVVEPDASTASYFLAIAALTGTEVVIPGLSLSRTSQGDAAFVHVLTAMGCEIVADDPLTLRGAGRLKAVDVDMSDASDVFMTAACVAVHADGPSRFWGIEHVRGKESDRLAVVADNLALIGIRTEVGDGEIVVHPGAPTLAPLPTYRDHRIAMAFATLGTRDPVEILDPDVTAKTCPTYFELLEGIGLAVAPR